jgi:hypothetical protein
MDFHHFLAVSTVKIVFRVYLADLLVDLKNVCLDETKRSFMMGIAIIYDEPHANIP